MLRILELFSGIGACSTALERLGIEHEIVDAVEIDKYAITSFNAIHGTNFEPQDITIWDKDIECDLIMHGSPCQDFSVAGKQAGGDEHSGTRSSLMYETLRIVEKLKPKYVIWENVKNILSAKHKHNFNNYLDKMKELGYENYYQVLNAKDYGIPQNRERVFTISIRQDIDTGYTFPQKQELKLRLKDMLESNVDEKYYLSQQHIERITLWNSFQNPLDKVYGGDTIMDTITTRVAESDGGGISASAKFVNEKSNGIENLREKLKERKTLCIKNNTKQGYLEAHEGDGVYTNVSTKRGTVTSQTMHTITSLQDCGVVVKSAYNRDYGSKGKLQENDVCDTLQAAMGEGGGNVPIIKTIGNYSPSGYEASRVVDSNGLAPTVKENHGTVTATNENLRIRKLTPKECWRLMGFTDEEFEKAAQHNSNSQLYKQAGNSIVVNVLEKILSNLLGDTNE